jgi:hypothetical protein
VPTISRRTGEVSRNVTKGFGLESVPRHDLSNGKRVCNLELTSLCTAFLRELGRGSGDGIELARPELIGGNFEHENEPSGYLNARNFCTR